MAKLIVSRPLSRRFGDAFRSFRILIDGKRVASVDAGKAVEIELLPGRHLVTARVDFLGSQPVEIDANPGEPHSLAVIYDPRIERLFRLSAILPSPVPLGLIIWELVHGGPRAAADSRWLSAFLFPASFLPFAFLVVFLRNHCLALLEFHRADPSGPASVESLHSKPVRVRISIGQIMIAVALLAVFLGTAIELTRRQRWADFRSKARVHASLEDINREFERGYPSSTSNRGNGWGARDGRAAVRYAARADYHAAMKRKYEQAAARHVFSVEPDPLEPPLP